ncbi:MAG: hypothetical protein LBH18_03035, partial [Spirochaetaceae bacterium]|nr:hypothetical protein [Spirochaetaceae bacterium]
FPFKDYCSFNAERGLEDADLDKTLAIADARLELRFYEDTSELKLKSETGYTGEDFLQYQVRYASKFFFTENRYAVELNLSLDNFDEETRRAVEVMPDSERNSLLKSVFEKSNGLLIEPDEEDGIINYWRRIR